MRVEYFSRFGSFGEPWNRVGRMEISVRMGRVGVRLERVRFVVRSRELQRTATHLQRLRTTHLPWRSNGLPAAHSEHPAQSAATGLAGLRILLATGAQSRQAGGGSDGK